MEQKRDVVRECRAMLAGMTPVLKTDRFLFCTTSDKALAADAWPSALALFREEEGLALVLPEAEALRLGFDGSIPMARIVLEVYSALDGVGLTATVATALAAEGISCNMIAAYHHDNVFVPDAMKHRAMDILNAVQRRAEAGIVGPGKS